MARRKHYTYQRAPLRCVIVREVVAVEVDQLTRRVHRRVFELGTTMASVAREMGISPGRLSQLIGSSRMTEEHFNRLSLALDMKPADWSCSLAPSLDYSDGQSLVQQRVLERAKRLRELFGTKPKARKDTRS